MKRHQGLYILFFICMIYACANRVTPTGGAKDVKPPVIVTMVPPNYSVNFNGRGVQIKFDEYIQLNDLQKQMIISPLMDPAPVITARKRSLIIELPKELRGSTTYNINFGNAIVDIHENNALESFQYVFSSGPVLDSLFCKGKAVDAYKQKGEKGISILLYRHFADSLPLKTKPDYFARTNENGEFKITNISAGSYMIVALNDKNGNYICDSPQEEAISLNKSISPDTGDVLLSYFKALPNDLYIKKTSSIIDRKWSILMNKPSDAVTIKPLDDQQPVYLESWSVYKDTVLVWCADTIKDTLYIQVLNNDVVVDTARIRLKAAAKVRGRGGDAVVSVKNIFLESYNCVNGLFPFSNPEILFHNPIQKLNTANILLTADSVPVSNFKIIFIDSIHRKFLINHQWKEGSRYKLMMIPGALTDFTGVINDTIEIVFNALAADDFGTLQLMISNLPGEKMQLQLMNGTENIVRQLKVDKEGKYEFKTLEPGKYRVALLNDRNNNGRWDTGNYNNKIAPEEMFYFEEEITVRANWELEQEWKVSH